MSSSSKKGKAALVEFENHTKELRQLLSEQLKMFDTRMEGKVWFLADLQEYYKRMAELESEYSKNLEKIAERFNERLSKFKSQRKERSTTIDLWQKVLNDTKNRARQRQAYSENLNTNIVNRFVIMSDDYQRVYKKCREAGFLLQEELFKSVTELHRKQRKYHTMVSECKTAEAKFKSSEHALHKSEESGRKNEKMTKQKEKHQQRYSENKRKSIKAKNEYIMYLQAANKFLQTYFNKYLSDLIDGFDFNYHDSFKNAIEAYATAESTLATSTVQGLESVQEVKLSVESEVDKQHLFEDNQSTLSLPFNDFHFLPYNDDENFQISPQQMDIVDHHCDLFRKLKLIKAETDEIQKTVEATSDALKNMYKQWDNEMIKISSGQVEMTQGNLNCHSIKNSSEELELYYVSKFKENMMTNSLKIQLEAQNDILTRALGEVTEDTVGRRAAYHKQLAIDTKSPQAAAILDSVQKKTKIFGCNMSEYLKITGRQIPEVVESCVRFIKKFGLDHPGIFRLSGSSTDINDMKQLFEAGRDPLAGLNHWKDINAVAGLLRVYFRELEDSLFPKSHYQQFLESSIGQPSEEELIQSVAAVVNSLPEAIVTVMRFLFRFIHQVADHHEQNKMDAHNLAVVFGPTLLRIPSEQDMIAYQSHINGMMEVVIKHPDQIFPGETEVDSTRLSETEDSDDSDEDFEPRDAEALYDYSARSAKELSFRKGDVIRVYKRFNQDWWDGTLNDSDGFVPASYIRLSDVETTDGDHLPLSPTGDGLPKSSSVISPGDSTLQRPKDLNGPPRIPKREGSLKKRFDAPIRGDRSSPVGPSPLPPTSETRTSPQASTPFGTKSQTGFRITISTDDILNKQKNLRALPKDDPTSVDNKTDGTTTEEKKSSTLPRNHGSPLVSTEDLSKTSDDKDDVFKKNDNDNSFEKRAYSLDLDKTPDDSKPLGNIWQIRESTLPLCRQSEPSSSPRSSFGPKVPPAVKPKPKGGRGPNPPSRTESGVDLLASIHAAQAARTHRTSTEDKCSPEEKKRESQGSVGDDTQLL